MIKNANYILLASGILYIPVAALISFYTLGYYNIISSSLGFIIILLCLFLARKETPLFAVKERMFLILPLITIIYVIINTLFHINTFSFSNSITYIILILIFPVSLFLFRILKDLNLLLQGFFYIGVFYCALLGLLSFNLLASSGFNFVHFRFLLGTEFQEHGLFINFLSLRNFIICTVLLLVLDKEKSRFRRTIILTCVVFILFFSFLSGSRQAVLGIGGIVTYYFLFIRHNYTQKIRSLIFAALIAFFIVTSIGLDYNQLYEIFTSRFYSDSGIINSSDYERLYLINQGWNVFLDNPFFGVGGSINDILDRDPHNTYVKLLAEHGIIGSTLILLLPGWFLHKSSRSNSINKLKNVYIILIFLVFLAADSNTSAFDLFIIISLLYEFSLREENQLLDKNMN